MSKPANNKDFVFILVFAVLIFFGALFIFSSFNNTKTEQHISVRAIENLTNKQINQRIQSLHTRNKMFKSKISTHDLDFDDLVEDDYSSENNKFDLDVYENKAPEVEFLPARTTADKVKALLDADENGRGVSEHMLKQYKEQIMKKARRQGWIIKVNDDLEITSAKPL